MTTGPGPSASEVMPVAALPEAAKQRVLKTAPKDSPNAQLADDLDRRRQEAREKSPDKTPMQPVAELLGELDATSNNPQEAIQRNIHTEQVDSDPEVAKRVKEAEAKRRQRAEATQKAFKELTSGKPIKWEAKEYAQIRAGLDAFLNTRGSEILSNLDVKQRSEIYSDLMKDPQILQAFTKIYGERLGHDVPESGVAEAINKARAMAEKYAAKVSERDAKKVEFEKAKSDLDDPNREQKLQDLQDLNLDVELDAIEVQIKAASKQNDQELLHDLIFRRDGFRKQKQQRDYLADLPKTVKQLEADFNKLNDEVDISSGEKNSAEEAATRVKGVRRDAEELWVRSLENAARDAVDQIHLQNMEEVNKANDARLAETEQNAKGEDERKLAGLIRDEYYEHKDRGKHDPRSRIKLRGDNAKKSVTTLLKSGDAGARSLLQTKLEQVYVPGDPRIAEKMSDQVFVDAQTREIALNAMTVYLQTGGKIHAQEAAFIQSQAWGKDLIKSAMEGSAEVKKLDQELKDKGLKGGLAEAMKDKKKAAGVIALLLAVAAGTISAPLGALGIAGAGAAAGGATLYSRS